MSHLQETSNPKFCDSFPLLVNWKPTNNSSHGRSLLLAVQFKVKHAVRSPEVIPHAPEFREISLYVVLPALLLQPAVTSINLPAGDIFVDVDQFVDCTVTVAQK
jgi:hypothetical protein